MNNSPEDNDLITMGMDLGLYTFAKLFSEGWKLSPKGWKILADVCALNLEKKTGLPAEDLALQVEPTIREMLNKVGGENG